ncbi:hypothetical protein NUSPORA_00939 [Nucleospora cyclopteri]
MPEIAKNNDDNKKEDQMDNFIRNIADKKVFESIKTVEIVNKDKANEIKAKLSAFFNKNRTFIDYEQYKRIISDEKGTAVKIKRKNTNLYDLADIDDI